MRNTNRVVSFWLKSFSVLLIASHLGVPSVVQASQNAMPVRAVTSSTLSTTGTQKVNQIAPASPSAVCTNPAQTATLARKDEIIALNRNGLTQYSQTSPAWSSWSAVLDSGVSDFDAISRNRMIEIVQQSSGAFWYDWVRPDSSLAGRGRDGQTSLGSPASLTFTGRPALVERTPFEMWVMGRASNSTLWYRVWRNSNGLPDGTKWSPSWVQIPNLSNAASSPVVVFRDTNHLDVFYKDSANQAWFIEWAFGEWMSAPVNLNGSFTSDLSAVSLNDNHVAVLATDANGGLYIRQWTADKQPDWSDADAWAKPYTGMAAQRPAVVALNGKALAVATLGTNGWLYVSDYNGATWSTPVAVQISAAPPALIETNVNTLMLGGVSAAGVPFATVRTNGTWEVQQTLSGGLSTSKALDLVAWEPGEAVLVGVNPSQQLYSSSYTVYGRTPTWQTVGSITPMAQQTNTQDRYAMVRQNGKSVPAWLEKSNTNTYSLRIRSNWMAQSATYASYSFAETDISNIALVARDINGDGNDEIIVAFTRSSKYAQVYVFDASTLGVLSKSDPGAVRNMQTNSPIAVDVGDLDGDGKKNEIAILYVRDPNVQVNHEVYRFDGSNTLKFVTSQLNAWGNNVWYSSVSLTIAPVDPFNTQQDLLISGYSVHDANQGLTADALDAWRLVGNQLVHIKGVAFAGQSMTGTYDSIDLQAADLTGDGTKEIAASIWKPRRASELYVFRFDGTNWVQATYINDSNGPGPRISVGDLNGDGREEIIGSYNNYIVYRQKAGGNPGELTVAIKDTSIAATSEFVVGDINGDSVTVVADGCDDFRDLRVLQVLNAPPRWYNNTSAGVSQGAGASYAKSAYSGSSKGSTTSTTGGGSVSIGFSVEQSIPIVGTKIAEVRGAITQDFAVAKTQSKEDATTNTWTTSYSFDTGDNGNGQTGLVVYSQTKFRCYFFRSAAEPVGTHSMKVCAHLGVGSTAQPQVAKVSLEQWRSPQFKSSAGVSWVDVGAPTNLLTGANGYLNKRNIPANHFPVVKVFNQTELVQADVFPSPTGIEWDNSSDTTIGTEKSWETNTTISAGATAGVVTLDASGSFGFGGSKTSSTVEGSGQTYGVQLYGYDPVACQTAGVSCRDYTVQPYIYLRTVKTAGGETYEVHELDYTVPQVMLAASFKSSSRVKSLNQAALAVQAPVISSTTHPDPNTWYPTNTVTLNWSQPAGDASQITGYDWQIDPDPTYMPSGFVTVLTRSVTLKDVDEGDNFFTLVAKNNYGQLSPVAERQVLVDTQAPTVTINLAPQNETSGWHTQPLTATLLAGDGVGSGVSLTEYSLDGTLWQPYSAPLAFNTSTPGTTLWARATDGVGHVSAPVSVTFKIDLGLPSSLTLDGVGISYMRHITTATGNTLVVLGGSITDALSGPEAMEVSISETVDDHGANEIGVYPMLPGNELSTTETTLNWIYTPTYVVRGSYVVSGFAEDMAGNEEHPYALGTFVWAPTGAPDFSQTVVSSGEDGVYSGDIVTFTVAVRNTGTQEADLVLTNSVPAGMTVLPASITHGGEYHAADNTITWHYGAAWPGEVSYLHFSAQASLVPTQAVTVQNTLTLHPYYPDVLNLFDDPAEQVVTGSVKVLPPAATHDVTPHVMEAYVKQGDVITQPVVQLFVEASENTRFLYVREFTLTQSGTWALAQSSGWLPFHTSAGLLDVQDTGLDLEGTLTWTVSSGDGVKMLEVRAANAGGQVSSANDGDIIYTNLMSAGGSSLAAGEIAQYRVHLHQSGPLTWTLALAGGDADLYVWHPRLNQGPEDLPVTKTALQAAAVLTPDETGEYVIEVHAVTPSTYQLIASGDVELAASATMQRAAASAEVQQMSAAALIPVHTLTRGIPILDVPALPAAQLRIYLPMVQSGLGS